jgi:hypothetical protein
MNPSHRVRYDPLNTVCLHPRLKDALPIDHTVPSGTGSFGHVSQAFHARLRSFDPYGTTFDFVNRASFAKKSSNMNRWSTL